MTRRVRSLHQLLLPLLVFAALGAGTALATPHLQASDIVLQARPAYEGGFRVGTWLPIIVELENAGVDRNVEVRIGSREGAQYAALVELPNSGRKSVTVYAYMTPASRRLFVRLLSDGQELATQTLQLTPVNQRTRLVGVVAAAGATPRPPTRLTDGLSLVTVPITPVDLPHHPLGLSGLSTLVFEDVPTDALAPSQRTALREWVVRGGQLILSGGTGLERTLAGLPEDISPARVTAVEPVSATSILGNEATGVAELPLARLTPRLTTDGRDPYPVPITALTKAGQAALEQSLGRGTVIALPLPLGHQAVTGWGDAVRLWEELLRPASELPAGFAPDTMTLDGFIEGNMASTLTSLPALQFPPLGVLAGLLAAYIVLVGPVTYLVLRRLDRQALGWLVVPAITLVFAGLTYSLGYAQRGGDIVFNEVTLIEPVDTAGGEARVRTFVGIFSPERRSYTLQIANTADARVLPLLRPISVQGPWDTASPAGGVYLQDTGPGAEAHEFEIAQWSMRALATDSTMTMPGLQSQLRIEDEKLFGEVVNNTTLTLEDVTLVQGNRVVRLGHLAPNTSSNGELKRRQVGQPGMFGPVIPVSYLVYGEEMDQQSKAGGQPLPPELQQRVRLLDALFNYGPATRGGQPLLIAWADTAALEVLPIAQRVDHQRIAVITATPRLEFTGEVTLPQGWLAPRFEGNQVGACFGGMGTGLTVGPQPAAMQLVLPRDLFGFRPSELTLITGSDGPWIESTVVELYDWGTGAWVAQPITKRQIVVKDPKRFLSSHGMLRVQLSISQPQMNAGCVYIDAKLKGAL